MGATQRYGERSRLAELERVQHQHWLAACGGIEYGFKSHWTVKLEYDYLALSNWTSATVPSVQLNRDLQMVKAGINYKFETECPPKPSRQAPVVVLLSLRKTKT
jgi:hypothetical protein